MWRDKADPTIKPHLEKQIAETIKNRQAYGEATNPTAAQLWVAIANLSKEVFDLNLKVSYLEKASQEKSKESTKKIKIFKKKIKVNEE